MKKNERIVQNIIEMVRDSGMGTCDLRDTISTIIMEMAHPLLESMSDLICECEDIPGPATDKALALMDQWNEDWGCPEE